MSNHWSIIDSWKGWVRYCLEDIAGVDRAVGYSLLSKAWGVVTVPVTIWLITTKFTPEIQGYYYTFNSLLLLQTFLELGFTIVLVQFISHEWANLSLSPQMEIQGDNKSIKRLASLVDLGIKWYLGLSVTFFLVVGTIGLFFLEHSHSNIQFQRPWWLLCLAVSLNILLIPMRSFLEGSNRVDLSQKVYLKSNIVSVLAGWIAICQRAELYTAAIISLVTAVMGFMLLVPNFIPYFKILKYRCTTYNISWKKDFWPQQWRIGISWVSGFFMFQSFVPILFRLKGPIVAGQMGATLQIYNAVNAFSQSWVNAVAPKFGILGARKELTALKRLVKFTYLRSLIASIFFSGAAFSVIVLLHYYDLPQANRFADLYSIALLLLVLVVIQLSNVETLVVRFQKREPFVAASLSAAIIVLISNIIMGKIGGILYVVLGFSIIMLFYLIPLNHYFYKKEMSRLN